MSFVGWLKTSYQENSNKINMKHKTRTESIIDKMYGPGPAVEPGIDEPLVEPHTEPGQPDAPGRPDEDDPWRPKRIHPGTEPRPKARQLK